MRLSRKLWTVALIVATSAALVSTAAADELTDARRLEATLEYEQALALLDRALARGGSDPARYVELHLLAGRLAGGLDRPRVAEDHFARVLALRPDTTLPAGTSPKLTVPFAAAKARNLVLEVRVTVARGLVSLGLARDPLGLVAGIAVRVVDRAGTHSDLIERTATRLAIPAGATALEVAALDTAGNRIWVGSPPAEPATATPVIPPVPRDDPSVLASWKTWAVVTGVTLAAGGVAAWRFDAAQRDWDEHSALGDLDISELQAIETRGDRWGLAATLSFGVAAAAGVTTVILWLRDDGETPSEPRIVVTPGPGAGLGLRATF